MAPSVQRRKVWVTPTSRCRACTNAAKARNPLKFAGVPQTTRLISAARGGRSSPYYEGMWRTYCCLTSLFSDCRYSLTNLCDGAQIAIFGDFFASCICSEPRAARFRPASYISTKATPCVEVWQTSNLRRLRLGEEKKEKEEERTNNRMKI